jgi:hypothetical protein
MRYGVRELRKNGGQSIQSSYASVKLDRFHEKLLNSNDDASLMHGLLSVVFWGYAPGANNKTVIKHFALKNNSIYTQRQQKGAASTAKRSSSTDTVVALLTDDFGFWRRTERSSSNAILGNGFCIQVADVYAAGLGSRLRQRHQQATSIG